MSAPERFERELSWLEFNARVLSQALDPENPLLERLKFLAIVSSNLDEFFMVRVAALKEIARRGAGPADGGPADAGADAGLEAAGSDGGDNPYGGRAHALGLLDRITRQVREIMAREYSCLLGEVLPALESAGLRIVPPDGWTAAERRHLEELFEQRVLPLVTPLRVEEGAPFPPAGNLRVHAAFGLSDDSGARFTAVVQVPANIDRFVRLPRPAGSTGTRYALLEDMAAAFGSRLFPGYAVESSIVFKVTRDADFSVDEDREDDFIEAMAEVLTGRQNSSPVCLALSGENGPLPEILRQGLGLEPQDVYFLPSPLDLRGLLEIAASEARQPEGDVTGAPLRDIPWPPVRLPVPEDHSVWEEIETGDGLLHVPYESFDPVVRFLEAAAEDPSVLAIKMTLYRTSGDSPIVKALTRAARSGKQVTVVVELKARFDEERNITSAGRLEQAGAIITYGVARLKVHAKVALVVRRAPEGGIRRYLHLSTGNYNDRTARLYSDLSIFTANEDLCREASAFFNTLTGYSAMQKLRLLAVAPFDLKARLVSLIEREAQRSTPESPGLVMAKMNSLDDPDVIAALYAASRAGVRIMLNVRGVCTLVPGVPGRSETIEVRSIVGRYLEHSRILYVRNGGAEELYLSSADWLPRNLDRRIELMFPVLDERLRERVKAVLDAYFRDTAQSHRLLPDGSWERVLPVRGEKAFSAQAEFYRRAMNQARMAEAPQEELQVRKRPRRE